VKSSSREPGNRPNVTTVAAGQQAAGCAGAVIAGKAIHLTGTGISIAEEF
jgi:hypothetical protein